MPLRIRVSLTISIAFSFLLSFHVIADNIEVNGNTVILSGSEYNQYMEEIKDDVEQFLIDEHNNLTTSQSDSIAQVLDGNSGSKTIIYKFERLVDVKDSTDLPDWVKSDILYDHGFTLATDDVDLSYELDETIAVDASMFEMINIIKSKQEDTPENVMSGWFCSKKTQNKTKNFGNDKVFNKSDNASIVNITGSSKVSGKVKYKQKKRCGIPYYWSYRGIDLKVRLGLDHSRINALKFSYFYEKTLYQLPIFKKTFEWSTMAGPVYINGKHDIDLEFLINLFIGVIVNVGKPFYMNGDLEYEMSCSRKSCRVKDTNSTISASETSSGLAYSIATLVRLEPKLDLDTKHRIYVYKVKTTEIKTNTGISTPLTFYNFGGNTCSWKHNYFSDGNLFYMDLAIYGSARVDTLFTKAKSFNFNFGGTTIKVDEILSEQFSFNTGDIVSYTNIFFSPNTENLLRPALSVSYNPDSDIQLHMTLPFCLPDDLRIRGAKFSVDWGDGSPENSFKTTSSNLKVNHIFNKSPDKVKVTLTDIGNIRIRKDNVSHMNYVNNKWNIESPPIYSPLLIPVFYLLSN